LAGQFCKSGTNSFELLIDEDKLMEDVDISDYVENEYLDINETNVNKAFDNVFKNKNPVDNIKEDDFSFGFGMEKIKQFNIEENVSIENSKIIVTNNNSSKNQEVVNLGNINIEEPEIKTDDLNINFESINIEEPLQNKPKKIRIKKESTKK
jgi:hypothetical protein